VKKKKENASNDVSNVEGDDERWKILRGENQVHWTWTHLIPLYLYSNFATPHHTTQLITIIHFYFICEALRYGANDDGGDRHLLREARENGASGAGRERAEEAERGAREGAQRKQGARGADEARSSERAGEAARGRGGRGEALLAARGARSGGSLPGTWLPRANRLPHGTALTRAEPPSEDRSLLHSGVVLLVIINKNVLSYRFWHLHIRVIVAFRMNMMMMMLTTIHICVDRSVVKFLWMIENSVMIGVSVLKPKSAFIGFSVL